MDDATLNEDDQATTQEFRVGLDDLVFQADALVEGVSALGERYARIDERLSALPGAESAPTGSEPEWAEPVDSDLENTEEVEDRRVVAVELASSGWPVEEIDAYLLEAFGSEDNADVLSDLPAAPSPTPRDTRRRTSSRGR